MQICSCVDVTAIRSSQKPEIYDHHTHTHRAIPPLSVSIKIKRQLQSIKTNQGSGLLPHPTSFFNTGMSLSHRTQNIANVPFFFFQCERECVCDCDDGTKKKKPRKSWRTKPKPKPETNKQTTHTHTHTRTSVCLSLSL